MSTLIVVAIIYAICLNLPVIVLEQISGFWSNLENAVDDYSILLEDIDADSDPSDILADVNEWAETHSEGMNPSFASWLYMLLVAGPLTLGLSQVWLCVLRGQRFYVDTVFSGFGNFIRALLLNFVRAVFIFLWSILLVVPGIIAYYRYSMAFFLLADNPKMAPFEALTYSKYYMQGNKGSRFFLDLSFIGWYIIGAVVSYLLNSAIISVLSASGVETGMFVSQIVMNICTAVVLAPITAYRGVASADYYHRVICKDPRDYADLPELTQQNPPKE